MKPPPDPKKSKVVALRAAVTPTVKSPKLPAIGEPLTYRAFDDFTRAAEALLLRFDDVCVRHRPPADDDAVLLESFYSAAEFFDHPSHYDHTTDALPDLLGIPRHEQIKRALVGEQIGALIAGFPYAAPNCSKLYTPLLSEEVIAANPRAYVLEAACRQIRRDPKPFPPTPGEMLEALKQEARRWAHRFEFIGALAEAIEKRKGEPT